jgi:hypothetical protein
VRVKLCVVGFCALANKERIVAETSFRIKYINGSQAIRNSGTAQVFKVFCLEERVKSSSFNECCDGREINKMEKFDSPLKIYNRKTELPRR